MDTCRHLMLAPHSAATIDILVDEGIPLVVAGGLAGLTLAGVAARCGCTRQAVQQWCSGRPLRTLFAERFVGRWIRWCAIRTYGGRDPEGLLPEDDEVVGWTKVWLALVEVSPRDPALAALVTEALDRELELLGSAVADDSAPALQALVAGLRQARCLAPPALDAAEAGAILAAAVRRAAAGHPAA